MKNEKWDIYKPAFRKIRQSCPDLLADCWGRRTDFPSLRGRGPESAPPAATAIREHWTCKLLLSIFWPLSNHFISTWKNSEQNQNSFSTQLVARPRLGRKLFWVFFVFFDYFSSFFAILFSVKKVRHETVSIFYRDSGISEHQKRNFSSGGLLLFHRHTIELFR